MPSCELEIRFLPIQSKSTQFDRTDNNPAEDMVDKDTHNHHTLNVDTAPDATSQADLTALPGNQSARSATRLAIGSLSAEAEDYHPRQTTPREVSVEPNEEPPEGDLDTTRGPMLLTWEPTT